MRRGALDAFLAEQIADAKAAGRAVLGAPEGDDDEGLRPDHLRPRGARVLRGRVRRARRRARRAPASTRTTGSARCSTAIEELPDDERAAIEAAIAGRLRDGPALAMVDSDRGITNLHVPSDVIIDASMPAAIRASGQMWNADGELQDTKSVIPDHSLRRRCTPRRVDDCREHGAFDPATMGTTPNVGLMAQKAEEYGSHDKTFEIAAAGHGAGRRRRRRRRCSSTRSRRATSGACARPRTPPIQDWVRLAVDARPRDRRAGRVLARRDARPRRRSCSRRSRADARASSTPTGCRSRSWTSPQATRFTLERAARGRGHDLGHRQRAARLPHRPVPDPRARHQRQDALDRAADERRRAVRDRRRRLGAQARAAVRAGEPPALGLARRVPRAGGRRSSCSPTRRTTRGRKVLADTLDRATGTLLEENRSPSRKVGRARQPRQPLLPGAVLGAGAGRADRRRRAGRARSRRWPSGSPRDEADDRRASSTAVQGSPVRHRRLLPARRRARDRRRCARARRSTTPSSSLVGGRAHSSTP